MTTTEFRISHRCKCGAKILCKSRLVGQNKNCPGCESEFVVPHPPESFWVVLPERTLDIYETHARSVIDYAFVIRSNNRLFLSHIKQIIRTLSDLHLFATDEAERLTDHKPNSAINKALRRLSEGPTFAGYKSPHRRYTKWIPPKCDHPTVAFIRLARHELRLVKRALVSDMEMDARFEA